jgi:hypothetical protein
LAILCFLLATGLAIAAAVALRGWQLPDPDQASPEQLLRWLVTRDLGQESADIRGQLARRLEEAFPEKVDWPSLKAQLDTTQRARLWKNVVLLLEPWFLEHMEGYFGRPPAERIAFLDGMLDRLATWRGVETLRADEPVAPDSSLAPQGIVQVLLDRVEQWKKQAEPRQRERITDFVAAVQTRWVQRQFSQLF